MSIEVSNLQKIYGTQKAVNNISFKVDKGEIVGFLGPNGAGKSTTMKMITGYITPDAGTARVCGIDVTKDPYQVKQKLGYLPESNPLYYDMYVKEYLDFIAEVHKISFRKKAIEDVIEKVGLTRERAKKIGQLSKGYKQRVGLAAALIHQPEVLILDEPTTGLDPNQIIEIREVIREQGKSRTVLFSSHILSEVEALCDRVIIINKGELVADDLLSNLKNRSAGEQSVTVSFSNPADPGLFAALENAELTGHQGNTSFEFRTNDPDRLKKQLLELSLQQNLNIVSLQSGSSGNLEEIFRQLTQEKPIKEIF
jgi:ABC-2 type transport system ATP-binding protein